MSIWSPFETSAALHREWDPPAWLMALEEDILSGCLVLPSFLKPFLQLLLMHLNETFKRAHALENKNIPIADHPEVYRLEWNCLDLSFNVSAGKTHFKKSSYPAFSIL